MKKWTSHIKLTRLIVVMMVMAILSSAWIGYNGLRGTHKVNQNLEQTNTEVVVRAQLAKDLIYYVMTARIDIAKLSTYGYIQSSALDVSRINAEVGELLEAYSGGIAEGSQQATLFGALQRTYINYVATWEVFCEQLEAYTKKNKDEGDTEAVEALRQQVLQSSVSLESMAKSMVSNLSAMTQLDQEEAMAMYRDSVSLYEGTKGQILWVTVLSSILLLALAIVVVLVVRLSLKDLDAVFRVVSKGDFSLDLGQGQRNEFGHIKASLSATLERVSESIVKSKENMNASERIAKSLFAISDDMSRAIQEVASSIQEVASGSTSQAEALSVMTQSLEAFGESLDDAVARMGIIRSDTEATNRLASRGNEELERLSESSDAIARSFEHIGQEVRQLDKKLQEVGHITSAIQDISRQTDLLALNATIEAARVGDVGRGFAVVAEEVRKLAVQSGTLSTDIRQLIEGLMQESAFIVKEADASSRDINTQKELVEHTIEVFKGIIHEMGLLPPKINAASTLIEAIGGKKDGILEDVSRVSLVAMEQSALSEEIAASAEETSAAVEVVASTALTLKDLTMDSHALMAQFITRT